MHVLEAKQKQLSKKYSMLIWGYIKMWFTIPKIIITLTIISFFYLLMSLNIKKEYLTIFMIALAIVDTLLTIKLSKKAKKRFQQKKKKYLLEEMIFKVGAFSNLFIFSNLLHLQFLFRSSNAVFFKLFVALLLTTAIIYSYVSLVLVPKKADELLNITYPEYKSASFL